MKDHKGIIMGDFNTPLRATTKSGGLPLDLDSRQHLVDMINDLALMDVDLEGGAFT